MEPILNTEHVLRSALAASNEQHRTVIAKRGKAHRAGPSWTMRRYAVVDQVSISDLTERLADVTAGVDFHTDLASMAMLPEAIAAMLAEVFRASQDDPLPCRGTG